MAETINTQTTGYECVGIEKIEQTYEGLFDNKPNIITIYLTNGDTHQFKVKNGSQGVGIDRIEQRQSSTTNGGRNEFAIILTNGKEYTFSTYNGSGGSGSSGSFNQVLQHLNNLLMPSGKSYLYYNGSGFEWKSPDGSTGGGTTDLSEYSWWGRKFDPASKSITGEMSSVTGIEFQSTNGETVIRKKLHLDENGDLCFDGNLYATGGITALGSGGGTSGGSGVSLGTLLTKLNTDNPFPTANGQVLTYDGSNFVWKTSTGSGVTLNPTMDAMNKHLSKTDYGTPQFLYWDGSTYTWKDESEISGSGGSSSRINTIKLFNSLGNEFDSAYLGTGTAIGFMQGDNVTLQAVVKDNINVIKISANGGSGSSGGSSGSVDLSNYLTKTDAASTYAPKSHSHIASDITNFVSSVKAVKVNNAILADKANELNSPVTLWGNNFYGSNNIGTTSSYADLRYVKNIYAGSTFDIKADNKSVLRTIGTDIHIGFDYKSDANTSLILFGNKTKIFTNTDDYHFDFINNVFDVNTNTIHFGYAANGGKISWDANNSAFKIEGNVYATGGITALGVSNSATTSNNVDFTFKSVTANTFNVKNSIQLSDSLSLCRDNDDVYLASSNTTHWIYLDGTDRNYGFTSGGDAYFNNLTCDTLDISSAQNFRISEITSNGFKIQFDYGGKTYSFIPSEGNVTVS